MSNGVGLVPGMEKLHDLSMLLTNATIIYLNKIIYHNLCCAACVLHQGLRSFMFSSPFIGNEIRATSIYLVQKILSDYYAQQQKESEIIDCQHSKVAAVETQPLGRDLGKSSWNFAGKCSFSQLLWSRMTSILNHY